MAVSLSNHKERNPTCWKTAFPSFIGCQIIFIALVRFNMHATDSEGMKKYKSQKIQISSILLFRPMSQLSNWFTSRKQIPNVVLLKS